MAQDEQGRWGRRAGDDVLFLPSFCELRVVFALVVIGELLAFILVLRRRTCGVAAWQISAWASLFIQWTALCSAAMLCVARGVLARMNNVTAAGVSYLLLLMVTLLVSETAYRVVQMFPVLAPLNATNHLDFLLRNLGISAVISAVTLRHFYVQHRWRLQVGTEARARVDALQARIRPHFLFNALNTIAALITLRPQQAEEAVQDLSDLFRASLGGGRDHVTLQEEVEIARRYENMEKLRLGERLEVRWELEGLPMQQRVLPLLLQPLLENAIYHGVEALPEGGRVEIRGRVEGRRLEIEVTNPVPGFGDGHAGNRMAQDNIRQRLELAYGERGGLEVIAEPGSSQYLVRIFMPIGSRA